MKDRWTADLAKDDVLSVEVAGRTSSDEKLRSIAVGARVCHGKKSLTRVLDLEGLVLESPAVNLPPALASARCIALGPSTAPI